MMRLTRRMERAFWVPSILRRRWPRAVNLLTFFFLVLCAFAVHRTHVDVTADNELRVARSQFSERQRFLTEELEARWDRVWISLELSAPDQQALAMLRHMREVRREDRRGLRVQRIGDRHTRYVLVSQSRRLNQVRWALWDLLALERGFLLQRHPEWRPLGLVHLEQLHRLEQPCLGWMEQRELEIGEQERRLFELELRSDERSRGSRMRALGGTVGALVIVVWLWRVLAATQSRGIVRAPGWRLRGMLGFLFGPKAMTQVFDPLLGDIDEEYFQHLAAGRPWHARATRVRGCMQVAFSATMMLLPSAAELVEKIGKLGKS